MAGSTGNLNGSAIGDESAPKGLRPSKSCGAGEANLVQAPRLQRIAREVAIARHKLEPLGFKEQGQLLRKELPQDQRGQDLLLSLRPADPPVRDADLIDGIIVGRLFSLDGRGRVGPEVQAPSHAIQLAQAARLRVNDVEGKQTSRREVPPHRRQTRAEVLRVREMSERVAGDDHEPEAPPRSKSRMSPSTKRTGSPAAFRLAASSMAREASRPRTSCPSLAKGNVSWPVPQASSRTGPPHWWACSR